MFGRGRPLELAILSQSRAPRPGMLATVPTHISPDPDGFLQKGPSPQEEGGPQD